mmetsp:Transcript_16671/g.39592  ORF Transcript_16671/g.39592 Transcript_16671/m.39592 type:complete len:227 (+) Transcript_16671:1601-2281(+)
MRRCSSAATRSTNTKESSSVFMMYLAPASSPTRSSASALGVRVKYDSRTGMNRMSPWRFCSSSSWSLQSPDTTNTARTSMLAWPTSLIQVCLTASRFTTDWHPLNIPIRRSGDWVSSPARASRAPCFALLRDENVSAGLNAGAAGHLRYMLKYPNTEPVVRILSSSPREKHISQSGDSAGHSEALLLLVLTTPAVCLLGLAWDPSFSSTYCPPEWTPLNLPPPWLW